MKSLSFLLIFITLFCVSVFAQENVAVLEIERRASVANEINRDEAMEITNVIRSEAVRTLPPDKFNVMTSETVQSMSGAVLADCADESCIITIGRRIDAEYIVRGTLSKFQTRYTLNIEMFETEYGNLITTADPIRSENLNDILDKSAAACADMYRKFLARMGITSEPQPPQATAPSASAPTPPPAPSSYSLTVRRNPPIGGTVRIDNSARPMQRYNAGTKVTIIASPARGYKFTDWTDANGATAGADSILEHTVNENMRFTANFEPVTYKLTVNTKPDDGGTVSISPNLPQYNAGSDVTVTATPKDGYRFISWTNAAGRIVGTNRVLDDNMNSDKILTANFAPVTYKLTVNARPEGGGTVNIDPNLPNYSAGATVTVAAAANEGYTFAGWRSGMILLSTADTMTITMNNDMTLNANYRIVRTAGQKRKMGLQVSAATLAIGGLVGGLAVNAMVESEHERYNAASNFESAEQARKNIENYKTTRNVFYALGAVGLCGLTVTFFF